MLNLTTKLFRISTIDLLVFFILGCTVLGCTKELPQSNTNTINPGFQTYTVYGHIEDKSGNPMRGLELTIVTKFKTQTLVTDSDGEFQATTFQGYQEPTRFELINPIGDTAYYQVVLSGARNQKIDFVVDERGSIAPK